MTSFQQKARGTGISGSKSLFSNRKTGLDYISLIMMMTIEFYINIYHYLYSEGLLFSIYHEKYLTDHQEERHVHA